MEENKVLEKDFKQIVENIKSEIYKTQTLIMSDANKRLIELYFYVGKLVHEKSSWNNKFIENLSIAMKVEFPNIKGFSVRNIKNMKKFYKELSEDKKVQMASAQIPWSHNMLILDKIKDTQERLWYMEKCVENGWSVDVLEIQINTNLYKRQGNQIKDNNFKEKLVSPLSDLANSMQKDPYIFNLPFLKEKYIEAELEKALVERIKDTLIELGKGFCFIGNQYKITIDNTEYFIDMLFYHLKLRCYVVVELKIGEFKPEYAGKMNFYINAINRILKTDKDNDTIGLILCKGKSRLTVEYSLSSIENPIGISSFEILPKEIVDALPTEEDLNLHIDINEDENKY